MRIPRRIARGLAVFFLLRAPAAVAAECGPTPYDCALFHVGRHEFAAAIGYLDRQLAVAPRDLKVLNLLGIALTGAGKRDAANERFRAALAIDPGFAPALKNLGVNEYDAGRFEAARGHFEQALKLAPADEIANLYLAEIHYRAKRHRAALEHYEKSGNRFAQDPNWILHYGRALLDAGRTKQAVSVLDRIPGPDGAGLFAAGAALGQAGAHAEAARFFAAARKGYKDPYAAGFNETLMRIEAGDNEGAIRVARELIAEGVRPAGGVSSAPEPGSTPGRALDKVNAAEDARMTTPAELYNLASRALVSSGRIEEAYDALRQATRLEPSAPENYVDLAMICLEHDNFDLGLEIVDIGLRHLPESWVLYLQRGVLLAMKGLLGEAETEFDTARRFAPDPAVPYAALGMVWIQSGRTEKAVEVLRAELKRRPDHVVPYIFAVALLRSGVDPTGPAAAEAVDALRASIRANPGFAPARAELGRLLLKRDAVDPAIQELEKAAALDPGSTLALYALSQAYRRKGDRARAQELLARVSQRNAEERGEDADGELKRAVVRIVREGTTPPRKPPAEP